MTKDEFNEKWSDYLEPGHYGLAINNEEVIKYLDAWFTTEVEFNPDFTYSQIKMKFSSSRVYANSGNASTWEAGINKIMMKQIPQKFNITLENG